MKAIEVVFNHISMMNPGPQDSFISPENQALADDICNEVISAIKNKDSLAYKIASNINIRFFSEKQLWVIAYELMKNEEYVNTLVEKANRIASREAARHADSKDSNRFFKK